MDKNIKTGKLYVVATPIGNKDDITLRALKILREVDLIAAEDTRKTGKLLSHRKIKSHMVSYYEHNEKQRTPELIDKLLQGSSIALVSNAGTPSVSDPGYRLIEAAIANKIMVVPIPGVSAATAAMSVAGLPTDSFVFLGFPTKKKGKRLKLLKQLAKEPRTLIFYESPKRILTLLEEIISTIGNRHAVVAREMTKLHEEFIRGFLSDIIKTMSTRPEVKGECTLLVAGCENKEIISWEIVKKEVKDALEKDGSRLCDIAKELAKKFGIPKSKVYKEALSIRNQNKEAAAKKRE